MVPWEACAPVDHERGDPKHRLQELHEGAQVLRRRVETKSRRGLDIVFSPTSVSSFWRHVNCFSILL
jgi:hypothetical protein